MPERLRCAVPAEELEETVQTLAETLKTQFGGNISDEDRQRLAEWAKFYENVSQLCKNLLQ